MEGEKAERVRRIAVVGSGPRGMGVLERLAARLLEGGFDGAVEIYLIDAVQLGCGRVWHTDQPEWFLMNTVAGEVMMFSGPPDDGPARPGAGPSLAQWWESWDPMCPGPDGYAPRALHGRYMRYLLGRVKETLPPNVRLHERLDWVEDLERGEDCYRLSLAGGERLEVDRVVLTTGHTKPQLTGWERRLQDFAAERDHLRYIQGDSAADMPLDDIPADSAVGIIGIGLAFYDIMYALTIGRDGKFLELGDGGDGKVVYQPSGEEPQLVAGSRSGFPVPARGRNQKGAISAFKPTLFTPALIRGRQPGEVLDFRADVLPWLLAEMELVFHATTLRTECGAEVASAFVDEVAEKAERGVPDVGDLASRHGCQTHPGLDIEELSRPFARRSFEDMAAFRQALLAVMRDDLDRAERGNYDDPLKAALDVIRDTRWVVRELVDYGGLHEGSHRADFLDWFSPRSSFLAAGPPRMRVRYAVALIESGVLRVVGPDARFAADPEGDRFVVESPHVTGSEAGLDVVVDARIPNPDLKLDPSPLTQRLRRRGIWTEFVNGGFQTGGVAVTRAPFHPIDSDGVADTGLYVLGVPTEHTRWFTLVGSGRPGPWNEFIRDADAIAEHVLSTD